MTVQTLPEGLKTYDLMVDIDDVIVPWFETVNAGCIEAWGEPPTPCTNWHMWEHWGRTREEWGDVVVRAVQTGLYHSVDPLPGSVEAVNRLRWAGHRVHIVTARGFMTNGDNIREWTPAYLETFGVGHDSLTFAKDKVAAQGELGVTFDFAIDDGGHNYDALDEAGIEVWLHEAPHNGSHPAERRVRSLWDWAAIIEQRAAA